MQKGAAIFFCIIILIFSLSLVNAQENKQYHLKLLAVQDDGKEYEGSDADLFLEIKEGSGRVFLETFPLTKFDTQISTRFAKDIACNHFKLNCNQHDFIYTIKAKTNIIGGPSAGAAIAALTTIGILNLKYDDKIAITGTINSGGIIGPVGGVKEKMEAAARNGLQKVLIPKGTALHKPILPENITNTTKNNTTEEHLNLIQYGKENLSLEIIEVVDLDEVIFHFTGVDLNHKNVSIEENKAYREIMRQLQEELCTRTAEIEKEFQKEKFILDNETFSTVEKKKSRAENATAEDDFYSAASFCFGANIGLKNALFKLQKLNRAEITKNFAKIEKKNYALEKKVDLEKIETISDLQAFMVVKERLNDVKQQLKKFEESKKEEPLEELYGLLAYTEERYFSAISWMQFFNMEGKKYHFEGTLLQKSCEQKIAESEERHQYVTLFIGPVNIIHIKEKIDDAKGSFANGEFALCLITAAQAKAEANAILSSIGVQDEAFEDFLNSKQTAVERLIAENSVEGIFPILGYSYYQYANSLRNETSSATLVYLEYALEMSDLGIYFPEEKKFLERIGGMKIRKEWWYFGMGLALGLGSMYLIMKKKGKPKGARKSELLGI
ncbi:hypothetical protein J4421_00780 [Candidatus Woesearchaeota archaeon]|nr:hypothetical protein [Candidatus Woesearchaeota archaeon]